MSGVVPGAVGLVLASAGWSEAGGPDSGTGNTGGGSFVHSLVGAVGGT